MLATTWHDISTNALHPDLKSTTTPTNSVGIAATFIYIHSSKTIEAYEVGKCHLLDFDRCDVRHLRLLCADVYI